jgi:hypothetical protein
MWICISDCLDVNLGSCFESIGKLWLSNKKNIVLNIFTSALRGLWKLRNCLCFQNGSWRDVDYLLMQIVNMIHNWKLLCPPTEDGGARIKSLQAEILSKQAYQADKLVGTLKGDLFNFLLKHGGDWGDNQVPKGLSCNECAVNRRDHFGLYFSKNHAFLHRKSNMKFPNYSLPSSSAIFSA